jgi:hypothetical protein
MLRDRTSDLDPDRDYLREQIRKLVQLVARVIKGAQAGEEAARDARTLLADQASTILGPPYEMIERLTPSSAAALLKHDPERLRAYAAIVSAESDLLAHLGDLAGAARQNARAQALLDQLA